FYSNAKLKHDEFDDSIIVISSFLMNTPIRLTIDKFGDLLHLPSGGNSNEKDVFNLTLFISSSLALELSLHNQVFHIVLTWNLRPIMKHAKLQNIDYWWPDSIQTNRRLDLALINLMTLLKLSEGE
ncbi:hypothetical protein J1N35_043664, partial [Gossypium stocksii]